MTRPIPVPSTITRAWLTTALRLSGALPEGEVAAVVIQPTNAFNSHAAHLQLSYSADATSGLPTALFFKRNIAEAWAIEAGADEVRFYQFVESLEPEPPAIVPCYAAEYDPASGDSYVLLQDLSATHRPPLTREQQISIVASVPSEHDLEHATDVLARHHAYWWDHPSLVGERFITGYWSRNADRFAQYLTRRRSSWDNLLAKESGWLPNDICELYDRVFSQLEHHWSTYLEPRFRTGTDLTLIHGDSYFANFLCPFSDTGETYLIDWQSPSVDLGSYDLANMCATFWTSEQRNERQRERGLLQRYHATLQAHGVGDYSWDDLVRDYQSALVFWLLMPVQDGSDGSSRDYWWPKMQCLVAAFREWQCDKLLNR